MKKFISSILIGTMNQLSDLGNKQKNNTISIIVDRDSVCMADDVNSHQKTFEFEKDIEMYDLVKLVEYDKEYLSYGGGLWAGHYDNYKCIRNNHKIWKINGKMSAGEFFTGINKYMCFERNSKKCK